MAEQYTGCPRARPCWRANPKPNGSAYPMCSTCIERIQQAKKED